MNDRVIMQSHGGLSPPWFSLFATAGCVGLYLAFGAANADLLYDRAAIESFEIWRLLAGHLVHTDIEHLVWNAGSLLILAMTAEMGFHRRWPDLISALGIGAISITVALLVLRPELRLYCGLSGVLNTLLVLVLYDGWKATRHWIFPAIAIGDVVKITTEAALGEAVFTSAAWPSVPEAHAAGLLAGIAIAFYRDARGKYDAPLAA